MSQDNPHELTREQRLEVARKIASSGADGSAFAGYWVEWVDELLARVAELLSERDEVRGGLVPSGRSNCTDCGRAMVWQRKVELDERLSPGAWMCPNCVMRRCAASEVRAQGLAGALRDTMTRLHARLNEGIADGQNVRPYEAETMIRAEAALAASAPPSEHSEPESTPVSSTWPYVFAFALAMEEKLAQNRHKGDREGWVEMDPHDLRRAMLAEAEELNGAMVGWGCGCSECAVLQRGAAANVLGEAADVANYAMMVADRCGALELKGGL